MKTVLCDPKADGALARLDDEARQQTAEMRRYYDAKKLAPKRTTDPDSAEDMAFVRDKFVALDPEKCDLCYMLCRSLKARGSRKATAASPTTSGSFCRVSFLISCLDQAVTNPLGSSGRKGTKFPSGSPRKWSVSIASQTIARSATRLPIARRKRKPRMSWWRRAARHSPTRSRKCADSLKSFHSF